MTAGPTPSTPSSWPPPARVSRQAPRRCAWRAPRPRLLDDGVGRRDDARYLGLLTVDEGRNPRRDLILPVIALVNGVVKPLALHLALEAADPHVDAGILLAHEAAEDDHAHLDLEGDDLLFHALDPCRLLPGTDVILPKLEEHAASWCERRQQLDPRKRVKAFPTAFKSRLLDLAATVFVLSGLPTGSTVSRFG